MSLLFIRHGSTGANAGDADPRYGMDNRDYFRGWTQLPLSPSGQQSMQQTAQFMQNIPIDQVVSSDLPRAAQSAQIIANGKPVSYDPRLRSMDIGNFTTQLITPERKKAFDYVQNQDRDAKLPGSTQSYNQWLESFKQSLPDLVQAAQTKNIAVVTHHRNLLAIPEIFFNQKAKTTDDSTPGSVSILTPQGLKVLYNPPLLHADYEEKAKS